jgi:hypothetical protein
VPSKTSCKSMLLSNEETEDVERDEARLKLYPSAVGVVESCRNVCNARDDWLDLLFGVVVAAY